MIVRPPDPKRHDPPFPYPTLFRSEVLVLEVDFARHQAAVPLQCLDADRQAVEQRLRAELAAAETQKPAAGLDPGGFVDGDDRVGAVGGRDLQPVVAARGDDALDLGPLDRTSVVWGKSVPVRVDLGGRRLIKKKK